LKLCDFLLLLLIGYLQLSQNIAIPCVLQDVYGYAA